LSVVAPSDEIDKFPGNGGSCCSTIVSLAEVETAGCGGLAAAGAGVGRGNTAGGLMIPDGKRGNPAADAICCWAIIIAHHEHIYCIVSAEGRERTGFPDPTSMVGIFIITGRVPVSPTLCVGDRFGVSKADPLRADPVGGGIS
jgi:hypothetical protein